MMESSSDRMTTTQAAADDRRQPLDPNGTVGTRTTSLNDRLNTDYVNVGADDNAIQAHMTRFITGFVGRCVTPRRLLIILRILKAITFCFLVLTIAADLMYITFLEVLANKEIRAAVGGRRDFIIRVYGLLLAGMALLIELDVSSFVKEFYGFKGFIPRALLLFFISSITGSHPLHENQIARNNGGYVTDDEFSNATSEIPDSAVVFQMVTSFIL